MSEPVAGDLVLADFEKAVGSISQKPHWWWGMSEKYAEHTGEFDFLDCLEYNPTDEFAPEDVARIHLVHQGERDGDYWEWVVNLKNGRRYYVTGCCDYTGWDCQSSAIYQRVRIDEWENME